METATPVKKGSGLMIAGIIVLVLGIGTFVVYRMRKATPARQDKITGKSGWTQADKSEYKTDNLAKNAVSVTDAGNNRLRIQLQAGEGKRLFGTASDTVFVPKPTGNRYSADPAMLEKLKNKYGEGTLYQKGATIVEGFDYITVSGSKIFITMKDLFDMAKMNNDTGDIMNSSFYNN